jgi:hypothetical protein
MEESSGNANHYRYKCIDSGGKARFTSFSKKYYTQAEAENCARAWADALQRGLPAPSRSRQDMDMKTIDSRPEKNKFELPRKDFREIKMPPEGGASFLFLGSTRSGKTTFIKKVHEHFFSHHIGILHTCSPAAEIYKDLKKTMALAPEFCGEIIEETMKLNQKVKNKYEFLHLIDDCVSSKNDAHMIRLLTIGRNSNLSCIISGQELSILNAIGRSNVNFVFLGKLNSSMAAEKTIKAYLQSIFPTKMKMADKIKLYNELTSNYNWIVLDAIEGKAFVTKLSM